MSVGIFKLINMDESIIIDLRGADDHEIFGIRILLHKNGYCWISEESMIRGSLVDTYSNSIDINTISKRVTRANLDWYKHNSPYDTWPVRSFKDAKYLFNNKK